MADRNNQRVRLLDLSTGRLEANFFKNEMCLEGLQENRFDDVIDVVVSTFWFY